MRSCQWNSLILPQTASSSWPERNVPWPPKDLVRVLVERISCEVESLSYKIKYMV